MVSVDWIGSVSHPIQSTAPHSSENTVSWKNVFVIDLICAVNKITKVTVMQWPTLTKSLNNCTH